VNLPNGAMNLKKKSIVSFSDWCEAKEAKLTPFQWAVVHLMNSGSVFTKEYDVNKETRVTLYKLWAEYQKEIESL
jgi:hypothetical protein